MANLYLRPWQSSVVVTLWSRHLEPAVLNSEVTSDAASHRWRFTYLIPFPPSWDKSIGYVKETGTWNRTKAFTVNGTARVYTCLKNPSFALSSPDYALFKNFFTTDRGRRRSELAPKRRLPSHEIGEVALRKRALARDFLDKRENAL